MCFNTSDLPRLVGLMALTVICNVAVAQSSQIGSEKGASRRLVDGEEYSMPTSELIEVGRQLFSASWTREEGAGRPLSKGTGDPLSDPSRALTFPFGFNRISAPDSNSCSGCHNLPFPGGGGDIVANVFVLAQRFDFATFDENDPVPLRGAVDETGNRARLQDIGNSRGTIGMFGSGYVEMLARSMTSILQAQRDALAPGGSVSLQALGVGFGRLSRRSDGTYDTGRVEGLPAISLAGSPPNLIVRPFHQSGAVVSIRQFTNNAMNHHHGIQSTERFGFGDPDGDGFVAEMSRAEVTAVSVFQATLQVPGRVIPRNEAVRAAIARGERLFKDVGCSDCHRPDLPLADTHYTEPNPYNPAGNLRLGDVGAPLSIDLNDPSLPGFRLRADRDGITRVPAYTDLRLHRLYESGDPNCEQLNQSNGSLHSESCWFLTRKLWGAASEPGYGHHGQFTTLREAVEAHSGEATEVMSRYWARSGADRDDIVEFLKSLRTLPATAKSPVVDERLVPVPWPAVDSRH
jgi:cytochrome c peroxidase